MEKITLERKLSSLVYMMYKRKKDGVYIVQLIAHDAVHGEQFEAASKFEVKQILENIATRHADLMEALN